MKENVHETTGEIALSATIDYSHIPKIFYKRYWSTTIHNARAGVKNSLEKNKPKIDQAKANVGSTCKSIYYPAKTCVTLAGRSSSWAAQYAGNRCRYAGSYMGRSTINAGRYVGRSWMNAGRYVSRTSLDAGRYLGSSTYIAGRYVGRSSWNAGRYLGRATIATGRFLRRSSISAGSYLSRGSRSLYKTLRNFSIRTGRSASHRASRISCRAIDRAREVSYVSGPYYTRKLKRDLKDKVRNSKAARTFNDIIENSRVPKACHDYNCDCKECPTDLLK